MYPSCNQKGYINNVLGTRKVKFFQIINLGFLEIRQIVPWTFYVIANIILLLQVHGHTCKLKNSTITFINLTKTVHVYEHVLINHSHFFIKILTVASLLSNSEIELINFLLIIVM